MGLKNRAKEGLERGYDPDKDDAFVRLRLIENLVEGLSPLVAVVAAAILFDLHRTHTIPWLIATGLSLTLMVSFLNSYGRDLLRVNREIDQDN